MKQNNNYRFIDQEGEFVIPPVYKEAGVYKPQNFNR
ncbi:WG repeat-containing protein [Paenibacillus sp. Z6-24]